MPRLIIDELAKARGLNQKTLAEMSKVSTQTLNHYWNNRVRSVDLAALGRIAIQLGVQPGDLIVADPPPAPSVAPEEPSA